MKWGDKVERAIEKIIREIKAILGENEFSFYLYGSVTMDDFKLGWSDIDFLCLTEDQIKKTQAEKLLGLRQSLTAEEPDNLYYHSFEGAFLSSKAFCQKTKDIVVYWGTTGQRITDEYALDSFSMISLLNHGLLLSGEDIRSYLVYPTEEQLRGAIVHHLKTIRQVAVKTSRSIYSLGWLFDIARCIYTSRTGKIISKTAALEWALDEGLCPNSKLTRRAIEVRNNPNVFIHNEEFLVWVETLGNDVQQFADVLEGGLNGK